MPKFEHGWQRGLGIIVQGLIIAIFLTEIVPMFVKQGWLPQEMFWWVVPFSTVSAVMTVDASRFWSFGYLGGVVLGIFFGIPIFIESGLLSTLDIIIYTGIAIGAIGLRVKIHTSRF